MAKKVEATVLDMYSFSETRPKLREVMISREQYLDLFDSQLEENRVLDTVWTDYPGFISTDFIDLFMRIL